MSEQVSEADATATLPDRQGGYYYAHARDRSAPEGAKVISGPGITTGGRPPRLDAEADDADASDAAATSDGAADEAAAALRAEVAALRATLRATTPRRLELTKFAISDEGAKVKVYVDCPPGVLQAEGAGASPDEPARAGRVVAEAGVRVDFRARRVELLLLQPPPPVLGGESNADTVAWHSLVLDLGHAVVPQRCSHRVTAEKGRVTLILRKEDEGQDWTIGALRRG